MESFFFDKQVREITRQEQRSSCRLPTISSRDELREKLRQRLGKSAEETQVHLSKLPRKEREYGGFDRFLLASKARMDRMMDRLMDEVTMYC